MKQNSYLEKLLELKNNFSVKIITGIRGVGKTTLLKAFAESLRAEGVAAAEIIFIDCAADTRLKTYEDFYALVAERTSDLDKFFLLVDDIDRVAESEKAINALFAGAPAEIYLTASSEVLAKKIAALLPDNCDLLKMYPLPFAEAVKAFPNDTDALQRYLRFGGLPVTLDAYENVLPRLLRGATYEMFFDMAAKNFLNDAGLLWSTATLTAQNVGKPFNLKALGENNLRKAKNFLSLLTATGLFKKVPRFDIKSDTLTGGGEKFYCVDNGILTALAPEVDEAALIENAVCTELLRRGYSVSSGKFGTMNITFVATRGDEKIFIQVLPPNAGISVRKITRPLRALSNAETLLITRESVKSFGGVKNVNLHDFLLNV